MKVLLLNPPGSGANHLRDYYCAGTTKSSYYYHPVDLLYLSGMLAAEHEVRVFDAIARGWDAQKTLARIVAISPDAILSLVSAPTFARDHEFLSSVRRALPAARIIATGDVYREMREAMFARQPYLDASLVDFTTDDILSYLRGPGGRPVDNIIYRHGGGLVAGPEAHRQGAFSLPRPLWEEFPLSLYSLPIAEREPFMTVLSDFGCPFRCAFCPLSSIAFKLRPVSEVLAELRALRERGYREIHFRDQTFGVDKERTLALCRGIASELPGLSWTCFTRVDVLDEDRAHLMKRAGCHTVIFGIEFADEARYREMSKGLTLAQIEATVRLCRACGLRVAGEFIVGLPDQGAREVLATGAFAASLGLDFAAFNIAVPRMATPWRREFIAAGQASAEEWDGDTRHGSLAWRSPRLPAGELWRLRARLERGFYLRPGYLLRSLFRLRTWVQVKLALRNGLAVLLGF